MGRRLRGDDASWKLSPKMGPRSVTKMSGDDESVAEAITHFRNPQDDAFRTPVALSRPISALAPIERTNNTISSAYIFGMSKVA